MKEWGEGVTVMWVRRRRRSASLKELIALGLPPGALVLGVL